MNIVYWKTTIQTVLFINIAVLFVRQQIETDLGYMDEESIEIVFWFPSDFEHYI